MDLKKAIQPIVSLHRRLAFRFHWLLVLLMAFVIPWATRSTDKPGEFYPFSNFPMYATFTADTYLVFVTDQNDQPIPIKEKLGTAASDIKKTYDRKLGELKSQAPRGLRKVELPLPLKQQAANATLEAHIPRIPNRDKLQGVTHLKLFHTDISYRGSELQQTTIQVGEVPLP